MTRVVPTSDGTVSAKPAVLLSANGNSCERSCWRIPTVGVAPAKYRAVTAKPAHVLWGYRDLGECTCRCLLLPVVALPIVDLTTRQPAFTVKLARGFCLSRGSPALDGSIGANPARMRSTRNDRSEPTRG